MLVAILLLALRDPYALVERLYSENARVRVRARDALVAKGDLSVVPALVDAVFFNRAGRAETVAVLEALTGERHATAYRKWVEMLGRRSDIVPARGYAAFKAKQLAKIDPAIAEFLSETAPRTIRLEEIVWGGVKRDGIPPLEMPRFVPAGESKWLGEEERVAGVSIGGDARAYPLRILDWHEMVNDRVGGKAVSLAYCTLCGAAILYDGHASDGKTYTFGTSGLLYRSNKLMYDRQTKTLWNQFTGEPAAGILAGKGIRLNALPLTITTWREWRSMHPGTRVLSLDTGFARDYRPGAAYGHYFASRDLMFPVWKRGEGREPKEWVFVVVVNGARRVHPIADLVAKRVVHDGDVVIVTDPGSEAVRAYLRRGRTFRYRSPREIDDVATGETFRVTEEALVADGVRLPRVAGHRAYWFAAYALLPENALR